MKMTTPSPQRTAPSPRQSLALAVALGLMLLWGSNYSVQKAVMAEIGPGALVFMRYLVTPACAIALLLWRHGWRWPRLERRDWIGLAGLAALGHVAHVNVMTQAMHLSTAFSSALISALGPLFTLLLVRVLHGQPEDQRKPQRLGEAEAYLGVDCGSVSGPSAQFLVGRHLAGAVIGMRGSLKKLSYDLFIGQSISKPTYFQTHSSVAGFSLSASF